MHGSRTRALSRSRTFITGAPECRHGPLGADPASGVVVGALGLVAAIADELTGRQALAAATLLYLASAPLSAVLAGAGALLEHRLPSSRGG